jgi:hypothetical protein
MLKISKSHSVLLGCSAILATAFVSFAPSASAQFNHSNGSGVSPINPIQPILPAAPALTNGGNASGVGTSNPVPPIGSFSTFSPGAISRAGSISSRYQNALGAYERAAAALAQAETSQPIAANASPVRYGREPGDLASCGCPNADVVGSTAPTPELLAAKAAEAEAATELASAKAEARQFLDTVKNGDTATTTVVTPIW